MADPTRIVNKKTEQQVMALHEMWECGMDPRYREKVKDYLVYEEHGDHCTPEPGDNDPMKWGGQG